MHNSSPQHTTAAALLSSKPALTCVQAQQLKLSGQQAQAAHRHSSHSGWVGAGRCQLAAHGSLAGRRRLVTSGCAKAQHEVPCPVQQPKQCRQVQHAPARRGQHLLQPHTAQLQPHFLYLSGTCRQHLGKLGAQVCQQLRHLIHSLPLLALVDARQPLLRKPREAWPEM